MEIMEIQHFSHQHSLFFHEEVEAPLCNACFDDIRGASYTCKTCVFSLHKACAELPREIQHPFHPAHPLTLMLDSPDGSKFVCDGCGGLSLGFRFNCMLCDFDLDINCAQLATSHEGKTIKMATTHICHQHTMTRCNIGKKFEIFCSACERVLWGLAFVCIKCNFSLHESCLNTLPLHTQHLFHPEHPISIQPIDYDVCKACFRGIFHLGYSCVDCGFKFHVACINNPIRPLKNNCHSHDLFYIKQDPCKYVRCNLCDFKCRGSFYHCIECNFNIHIKCIPLLPTVKHRYHRDPLTFMDSFVEDDFGDYYCDICETQRNPDLPVYCCTDCVYIAHVECAISEVSSYFQSSKM